jgi:hypothetical protein
LTAFTALRGDAPAAGIDTASATNAQMKIVRRVRGRNCMIQHVGKVGRRL